MAAFQSANLTPVSVANKNAGRIWKYKYDTESLATISASAYFSTADTVTGIDGNDIGLEDEDVVMVNASDGFGFLTLNVTSAGVISTVSTFIPGANAEILAADKTLVAADNGKTFVFNKAAGIAVTLPAVTMGLKYRFVYGVTALTGADVHTVTAATAVIQGSHCAGGEISLAAAATVITFTNADSLKGDYCEVESDGTNWYMNGLGSTTQALTMA